MGVLQNIKAALFPAESDPDSPPAWVGRLKESKYSSLSGVEFPFIYLDLSEYIPIKSTSFSNIDGDGAYIQHNGIGGMRFPMLMILSGDNNDLESNTAIQALTESGDGTLYHPVHGPINVVPSGEINKINAFVTAANQTSIIVELLETTGILIDNLPPYQSALEQYLDDSSNSFDDLVNTVDIAEEVALAERVTTTLGNVKGTLTRLSNGVAATQAALDDGFDSINSSIDTLVKDPLMLARQVQNLILTPAREIGLIKDKLEAYANMARDIFFRTSDPAPNNYSNEPSNNLASDAMMAGAMVAGLTQISINNDFELKKDLSLSITKLTESLDAYIEWSDSSAVSLSLTDNSGDFQALNETISIANAQLLAQISTAQTEIKVTTTYRRNTAAWCYEFYGSIKPDALIYFQQTNDLGGDELFYIETFRDLVYYV